MRPSRVGQPWQLPPNGAFKKAEEEEGEGTKQEAEEVLEAEEEEEEEKGHIRLETERARH